MIMRSSQIQDKLRNHKDVRKTIHQRGWTKEQSESKRIIFSISLIIICSN